MISVIMPVYNNIDYLKKSIDSILSQTYTDFEFIIVDDCSTEPVYELITSYKDSRIVPLRNKKNIGVTRSMNIGFDIAKGEYVAKQDGDDISMPNRFEKQIERFKDNVGLVATWGYSIGPKGERILDDDLDTRFRSKDSSEIKNDLVSKSEMLFIGPSVIYSRAAVNKIGYYDDVFYFSQDKNYYMRVLAYFDLDIVKEELYQYRRHKLCVRRTKREMYGGVFGKERAKMLLSRASRFQVIKDREKQEWEN